MNLGKGSGVKEAINENKTQNKVAGHIPNIYVFTLYENQKLYWLEWFFVYFLSSSPLSKSEAIPNCQTNK